MELIDEMIKSFADIEKLLSDETAKGFIECNCHDLFLYNNFSFGIWIREHLLDDKSMLFDLFKSSGVDDLDEMSMIMIELFYFYMRGKRG